jgi:hypothetical protein
MGLDIAAFSNITVFPPDSLEEMDGMGVELDRAYINDDFEYHVHDYLDCRDNNTLHYACTEQGYGFRAGSYSTYNKFRRVLCEAVNNMSIDDLWNSGDDHLPFYHLLNFSDCEGAIGAAISAELLRDFNTHEKTFSDWIKEITDNEYFIEVYKDFKKGFEHSSTEGIMIFG